MPANPNPPTGFRTLATSIRERAAAIEKVSSRAQMIAVARSQGARVARLLGVPEIPVEDLGLDWKTLEGMSGEYKQTFFTSPSISLDRELAGGYPDPTEVLVHELAHAYVLRNSGVGRLIDKVVGGENGGWLQEAMANYIAGRLGYTRAIGQNVDDPEKGYEPGARFLAWLDEFKPGAGLGLARMMATGVPDPAGAFEAVVGQPLEYVLAAYDNDPYIDAPQRFGAQLNLPPGAFGNPPSALGRMIALRPAYARQGQKAMDSFLRKTTLAQPTAVHNRIESKRWQMVLDKGRVKQETPSPEPPARPPAIKTAGAGRNPNAGATPEPELDKRLR